MKLNNKINKTKKLFGIDSMPAINLSLSEVSLRAREMTGKLSISGVQPKLSLRLNRKTKTLETIAEGGEYILKPQIETFPNLPENEELCMTIAEHIGIDIPPHALLKLKDGTNAYIVKRFDRIKGKKIHQEDFFQILNKKDKYKGSLEEISKKLMSISDVPGFDVQKFYERIIFFFIIGNGDAHLKNFSIIYGEQGAIRLSPAYDIVSSKLVIPKEEDFALMLNGKRNKLKKSDFLDLAESLKIPSAIAHYFYNDKKDLINTHIKQSYLPDDKKHVLLEIVQERFFRLD